MLLPLQELGYDPAASLASIMVCLFTSPPIRAWSGAVFTNSFLHAVIGDFSTGAP